MYIRFLFLFFVVQLSAQKEPTIAWDKNTPLTWADFKDTPNANTDAAALTASGITFGFSIQRTDGIPTSFKTTVECLFYPNKSWYRPDVSNAHILKHEQMHFNITELHTRLFRQQLRKVRVSSNLRNELNALYKSINETLAVMQNQYDAETNHSINKEKQKEWETFILTELKKSEAYKTQ